MPQASAPQASEAGKEIVPTVPAADIPAANASVPPSPTPDNRITEQPAPIPIVAVPAVAPSNTHAQKPAEPAIHPTSKQKPIVKPRASNKPQQKLRKLCWKDGRLDVCP
jgi:hypothetical protein